MAALSRRIPSEGENLGRGIMKVDSSANHQVEPSLMVEAGRELARRYGDSGATKAFTAEISGIPPALATAMAHGVPLVYAREIKPVTMTEPAYVEAAPSHTKGSSVFLMAPLQCLAPGDRFLITDDFLANGQTIRPPTRLVAQAEAETVGIGALIEKSSEDGRSSLAKLGVSIHSLAVTGDMSGGQIRFAE